MPVYIAQVGENGPVKIGISWNVAWRLRDLQYRTARERLHLLRVIEGGRWTERWLHWRFAALMVRRREWFAFHPDMLTVEVPKSVHPRLACICPGDQRWAEACRVARDLGATDLAISRWDQSPHYPIPYSWWKRLVRQGARCGLELFPADLAAPGYEVPAELFGKAAA